jgi:DNA-binding transcriptional ArsR family regulator
MKIWYNTFNIMNVSDYTPDFAKLADLFSLLGQPSRLQILLLISRGEVCVCHIKAVLGFRQAYISQQLMGLRQGGWVSTRREGRSIYYRLTDPRLMNLIELAAKNFDLSLVLPSIPIVGGCAVLPLPTTQN